VTFNPPVFSYDLLGLFHVRFLHFLFSLLFTQPNPQKSFQGLACLPILFFPFFLPLSFYRPLREASSLTPASLFYMNLIHLLLPDAADLYLNHPSIPLFLSSPYQAL